MTKDEALKLALEALTNAYWPTDSDLLPAHNIKECGEATTAIKAALEAKDEPVGTVKELFTQAAWERLDLKGSTEVYTTPPQRQPLTDDEIQNALLGYRLVDAIDIVRAIEAAHGIKGET
jgi:hypothetical protein